MFAKNWRKNKIFPMNKLTRMLLWKNWLYSDVFSNDIISRFYMFTNISCSTITFWNCSKYIVVFFLQNSTRKINIFSVFLGYSSVSSFFTYFTRCRSHINNCVFFSGNSNNCRIQETIFRMKLKLFQIYPNIFKNRKIFFYP